jgi:hypothetical protein
MPTQSPAGSPAKPAGKAGRRPPLAVRSPMHRARNTNGSNFLPGIDGRSHQARRMYDVAAQVAVDLGGADRLSETRISLIRRFASLSVLLEEQEVLIARGEPVDVSAYSHMASTLVRLALRIGLKRTAKDITPTLAEYLKHDHDRQSAD